MIADPARCIPIMPSRDIAESRAFYVDRLGFSSVVYEVMKEFHIIDPHGNLLRFGCIPEEA